MDDANLTRLLAIVGAATGTLALGWDAFKWWSSEKVKLGITVNPGVSYTLDLPLPYTEVIIDNIGKLRTTIHLVNVEVYEGRAWQERSVVFRQFTSNKNPLPVSLEPGTHWNGTLNANADEVFGFKPKGTAYVSVYHSHSKKPVKVRLPKTIFATRY